MKDLAKLLHEAGMLAKTPRSGFAFLGAGKQSVAEHSYGVVFIAWVLAEILKEEYQQIDKLKVMELCLFHDLPEARTGDLNYVNKRYLTVDQEKILADIGKCSELGKCIVHRIEEYDKGDSLEALIAHDADQIELLLVLKELIDNGHSRSKEWFGKVLQRLKFPESKMVAQHILKADYDAWWNNVE